jgi:hypothetical protein
MYQRVVVVVLVLLVVMLTARCLIVVVWTSFAGDSIIAMSVVPIKCNGLL